MLNVGSVTYRNLTEQVAKNQYDINELGNNLAELASSGTISGQSIAELNVVDINMTGNLSASGGGTWTVSNPVELGSSLKVDGALTVNSDSSFRSDVTIDGDLNVHGLTNTGTITAGGEISTDSDVVADGYLGTDLYVRPATAANQLNISNVAGTLTYTSRTGITSDFVAARVSNGKLSIVIAEHCTANTAVASGSVTNAAITLSNDILGKLYPLHDTTLRSVQAVGINKAYQASGQTIFYWISKTSTGISIGSYSAGFTPSYDLAFTTEFNLML